MTAKKSFLLLSRAERVLGYAYWEHIFGNDKRAQKDIEEVIKLTVKEELEEERHG